MKNPIITLTSLAILGLGTLNAQVKIGDNPTNVDGSAALEVESNTKGFLPPRLSYTQREAISQPVVGLMIYNYDTQCLQQYNGKIWIDLCSGPDYWSPQYNHCGIEPTEVVEVTSGGGRVWMDRNLGAVSQASSPTHQQAYGFLFQWGRYAEGHQCISRFSGDTVTTSSEIDGNVSTNRPNNAQDNGVWDGLFITRDQGDNNWLTQTNDNNNLWNGIQGTNNPCPAGFRLPTEAEWDAEVLTWPVTSNRAQDAFNAPIKLTVAGARGRTTGNTFGVGSLGRYSTSTASGTGVRVLNFANNSSTLDFETSSRTVGRTIRCIRD